jgi:hypothetical protein
VTTISASTTSDATLIGSVPADARSLDAVADCTICGHPLPPGRVDPMHDQCLDALDQQVQYALASFREEALERTVYIAARAFAAAAAPLWNSMDGEGGHVMELLERAFAAQGLETSAARRRATKAVALPGCKVCGGGRSMHRNRARTTTYAMQRERWVKVGRALDVDARLRELARHPRSVKCPPSMDLSQPLTLVYTWPGDVEHELHERYVEHHAHGEWFHASILSAIGGAV